MEVVTAIAATTGKVAEYMVAPIGRQLGYLFCYGRNLNELSKKAEKIEEAKESTQHLVDAARNNGEEIERGALNWMRRVDEIYGHAKSLQAYAGHARAGCTSWSCPNLWSRHQLSRLAKKMSETIDAILGEKNLCEKISYRTAPKWIEKASITAGYMSFESRDMILNEIMEALKDPDINMIGVYGLGGVGKTTLVKDIARKAQEDKVFDVVAMSIVKHEQEVAKIQKEIAEMLGMKIEEESEFIRADRLHNRLKQEKNVLVILDDLWVGIDLNKIGIPFGSKQKGCKVLLTSRNQEVLSNQMDTQKDFFLGVLPKEEAWKLFKEMAGLEDLKENSEFLFTTAEVAEKCAGLPIALVTVGRALRNKSLSEWRDALRQLQSPTSRNISRLQEIVDNSIKLSFDYLESEELKNTFLLCAIGMGSNIAFTDLLKYSVGMRLFRGIYTIEAVRDRLNTLIGKLKARRLLLDSYSNDWFTMHDVVRDVAISIASSIHHAYVVRYDKLNEWPEKDQLQICTSISLRYSGIVTLPEGMNCPSLKYFCIGNNESSLTIPDSFFQGMCGLKVMDLTGMCFSHLPSSITLLTNLQTLCLDHCVLEDIAVVGELKNLKVLSLVSSDIKQLPHAIGQLTQLQLLDLQNCSKLEFIPPNIITSSKQLEVLKMSNNCCWWEAEIANSKGINASITELNCLPRLNTLEIWIRDPSVVMLTDLLFIKYLERYKILMGDVWNWSDEYKTSRTLKLKLNMSLSLVQGIKKLLERVEDLHLDELSNVKNVIYELNGEGFPSLKHLLIQNNDKIEYIVNSMDQQLFHPGDAFPILESLIIHDLIKLEKICIGQLSVKSFGKLQVIKVKSCHKLKNLFAFSTVSCFSRLLEIEVSKCNFMQEIVISGREESSIDNTDSQKMEFHQLHSLTLRNLPSLIGFHHDDKTFHTANEYDTYMTLFCEKALFPNLETLVISYMDNLKTIWSVEDVSPNSFGKLKSLNIKCSQKLLTIVPSNMLRKLQNLETLTVGDCSSLNDIFRIDARDESEIHGKVDIRLKNLSLEKLSELKHIWNKDPQGVFNYQMLKAVQVIGCDQFRNIFPASIVKCQELQSPGLKRLDVANCQKLELRGTESSNSRDTDRQDVEIKQPLTIVEKVMPNLEFLALGSKDTIWLLNGQSFSPASNFRKLEHLAFPSFPNEHELAYGSLKERVPCGRPMTIQEQHIMGKNTIYN